MKQINCALVGAGRISSKHLDAITNNADFKLVAICDTNEEVAMQVARNLNVPFYTYMDIMLEAVPTIDLIILCTPSGLHAEQAINALKRGKHVVTEKPMACCLSDAEQMIEAASRANKRLFVVKQNRLNPTVLALKQAIDDDLFGDIYMVQSNVFWTRPQSYYDQASWRGTWKMDGGAFMNQASHYVDLLEWLLGPIVRIQAMTKTLARKIEAEDTGVLNLEWENGALGSMSVTMLTYPKNIEGSITILGSKGSVKIGGMALNQVEYCHFESEQNLFAQPLDYQTDSVYGNGHQPYYSNVADVLLRGAEAVADGSSGLKSIKILSQIYQEKMVESLGVIG